MVGIMGFLFYDKKRVSRFQTLMRSQEAANPLPVYGFIHHHERKFRFLQTLKYVRPDV
jgi:hypothetical protein